MSTSRFLLSQTVKNVNFWVLLAAWGCGAGVFNALLIILPQYLCPNGYSNVSGCSWLTS